jgi:hypothetical protein
VPPAVRQQRLQTGPALEGDFTFTGSASNAWKATRRLKGTVQKGSVAPGRATLLAASGSCASRRGRTAWYSGRRASVTGCRRNQKYEGVVHPKMDGTRRALSTLRWTEFGGRCQGPPRGATAPDRQGPYGERRLKRKGTVRVPSGSDGALMSGSPLGSDGSKGAVRVPLGERRRPTVRVPTGSDG